MYFIICLMISGYAILYYSFFGGCLAASLFLILLLSILYTKHTYGNDTFVFQKEQVTNIAGKEFSIYGSFLENRTRPRNEYKIRLELIYHLKGEKKKATITRILKKGRQDFLCYTELCEETDFIEIHVKKVQVKEYTGSFFVSCKFHPTTVVFVRPKSYSLLRMSETLGELQEHVWENLEIKEYQPGDKLSRIHWKLMASKQALFIKNTEIDEEDAVTIVVENPKNDSNAVAIYTVLFSLCSFFVEHQINQKVYCGFDCYDILSITDVDEMLCDLYMNEKEEHVVEEWDYKLSLTEEHVLLESNYYENLVSLNNLEEIKDIRL